MAFVEALIVRLFLTTVYYCSFFDTNSIFIKRNINLDNVKTA
jgi:hypothetical protein